MSDRISAATSSHEGEAVAGGYFAPLAAAKYMLLITSREDGSQASVVVRGVVIDDRAYVRTWSNSDAAKSLRHASQVQVAPCAARGLLLLAPPLDAVARLLPEKEAGQVSGKLSQTRVQRYLLIPLLHRGRRRRMVYYELLAHATASTTMTRDREGLDAPDPPVTGPRAQERGGSQVTVVRGANPYRWPP